MSSKLANSSESLTKFSANQNEIILKFLSEGVCQIDTKGLINYANPSAQKMLGWENSEIIGEFYSEVFYAEDRETFYENKDFCPIDFALNEGEISHVNTDRFFKADKKSKFAVEYICVPIVEEEKIMGVVVSFQDVTERRDIEISIEENRKAALEAAQTKAAFLANMSHEIRTPLSGIIGTADLLLNSDLNSEQKKYVEMLKKSTDLLSHIVNDILDFSKMEAGKLDREHIEFNVYQEMFETLEFFKTLAQKKGLLIEFNFDESIPPKLRGDINSIRQILNNFISNSLKFTKEGKVKLDVANLEKNEKSIRLKFAVTDTGIGINEKAQEELFKPFTQADSTTTRKFGGTGLGLAISKQLVESMPNGEIGFESEVGKGTTFWFECVFEVPELKEEKSSQQTASSQNNTKITFLNENNQKLNVLIAEDNPINREIILEMLKQIGFSAKIAENGLQAVDFSKKELFDLILMDCHMPEMNGFEATTLIRERENADNKITIIAFTAGITSLEKEKCLRVGMDDYLSKPFTKNDLITVLKKHFKVDNSLINLDLQEDLIQHSLSSLIEPKILKSLLEVEKNKHEGFIFELLEVYIDHTEEKIAEINEAIKEKNLNIVKETAHNMKGSSANIGLSKLFELFESLERNSEKNDWTKIQNIFSEINIEFKETKKTISEK